MRINKNFNKLKTNYLFATVQAKVSEFNKKNPTKKLINMGIGDVTRPLVTAVVNGLKDGILDMSLKESFKGYGPYKGYDFLINPIVEKYNKNGINLNNSEVFITDGAKADCANILNIFDSNLTVLIPDPVYPVYVDSNTVYGNNITYLNANLKNGFLPMPNYNQEADLIYICSPNNPTGATYTKQQLEEWVDYAIKKEAIILFDSAYKSFVEEKDLAKSIFEIPKAKECAIEICSFSKSAGFTGTRCGYTIIPKELKVNGVLINELWFKNQTFKFNGVCYIVQKGAAAIFTKEGEKQIKENLKYYKENAKIICNTLKELKIFHTGGVNSPYIWFECFNSTNSWDFFDTLLNKLNIVGTPGEGFGENGKNFFRLTAFGTKEDTIKAMELIKNYFNSNF